MVRTANRAQQSAITHVSGPMLVIAGPGSGKTFVITERIKYLIEEAHIAPGDILVVTFSTAAAKEMQERFRLQMKDTYCPVNFGTFHAVFFHILQHTYPYRSESILRNEEKTHYLREIIEEQNYDITNEAEWIQEMLAYISGQKLGVRKEVKEDPEELIREQVYQDYQRRCKINQKIDFDDMMADCLKLFQDRKDVLEEWQSRYRYILVDEFQDISPIQLKITELLAGKACNLFVVGDDDQSIYGFRGARPQVMQQFEKEHPDLKCVTLDQNYRSTAQIVKASERMIRHNRVRYPKHMQAVHEAEGKQVIIREYENHEQELQKMIEEVKKLSVIYPYESIAVLCRTGYHGGQIAEQLVQASVPFHTRERLNDLYQHFIAQDLIAYMKLITGDQSRKTFYRIMNKPKRYISRVAVAESQVDFGKLYEYYRDKAYVMEALMKLQYDLRFMKQLEPYGVIQYITKGIGYEKYLTEYTVERHLKHETYTGILEEIKERAKGFSTVREWLTHIEAYERELRDNKQSVREGIALSTIHAAKGLEYDVVFIPDVYEGNIPHTKAVFLEELEEERRILYVAMTRAKERLYLCIPKKHSTREVQRSRFIGEIDIPLTVLYNETRK